MAPGPAASGPHLTRAAFELIVDEALDAIPSRLLDLLDNVAIMVEDEPPPDEPKPVSYTHLDVYKRQA